MQTIRSRPIFPNKIRHIIHDKSEYWRKIREYGEINVGNWFQITRCCRTLSNKVDLKKTILKKAEEKKVKKWRRQWKGEVFWSVKEVVGNRGSANVPDKANLTYSSLTKEWVVDTCCFEFEEKKGVHLYFGISFTVLLLKGMK
jgi:hypothetical protein